MSEVDKITFKNKMTVLNKDVDKRKDASVKIKKLWQLPSFIEKMKNRKPRPCTKLSQAYWISLPNTGEFVFIDNYKLKQFCYDHNIHERSLYEVINNKKEHHKQYMIITANKVKHEAN